jgi:hypothetical protein
MNTKKCNTCNFIKNITNFNKDKSAKDGLCGFCRDCSKIKHQKFKEKNPNYFKENYIDNREYKIKKITEWNKTYRKNNPEKIKITQDNWIKNNPNYHKEYSKQRREKDKKYKIINTLRSRTAEIIKKKYLIKDKTSKEILGIEVEGFLKHIESQFTEGMTWDNYGRKTNNWSIDHKIPLSSADNIEEVYKLCYYTNLQPLWHIDNIKKSNKT